MTATSLVTEVCLPTDTPVCMTADRREGGRGGGRAGSWGRCRGGRARAACSLRGRAEGAGWEDRSLPPPGCRRGRGQARSTPGLPPGTLVPGSRWTFLWRPPDAGACCSPGTGPAAGPCPPGRPPAGAGSLREPGPRFGGVGKAFRPIRVAGDQVRAAPGYWGDRRTGRTARTGGVFASEFSAFPFSCFVLGWYLVPWVAAAGPGTAARAATDEVMLTRSRRASLARRPARSDH